MLIVLQFKKIMVKSEKDEEIKRIWEKIANIENGQRKIDLMAYRSSLRKQKSNGT